MRSFMVKASLSVASNQKPSKNIDFKFLDIQL